MLQFLNGILAVAVFALAIALGVALHLAHRFAPKMLSALDPVVQSSIINLISNLWLVVVLIGAGSVSRASYAILGPGTIVSVVMTAGLCGLALYTFSNVALAVYRLTRSSQ